MNEEDLRYLAEHLWPTIERHLDTDQDKEDLALEYVKTFESKMDDEDFMNSDWDILKWASETLYLEREAPEQKWRYHTPEPEPMAPSWGGDVTWQPLGRTVEGQPIYSNHDAVSNIFINSYEDDSGQVHVSVDASDLSDDEANDLVEAFDHPRVPRRRLGRRNRLARDLSGPPQRRVQRRNPDGTFASGYEWEDNTIDDFVAW